MVDLTGFRLMRRVAHGRSRSLACREHHRRRLQKRNTGAPLHSHPSNDTLHFQEDHLFSRTGQAFFFFCFVSFLFFFLFFSLFFFFFFLILERDCLLCAICDTWLRAWNLVEVMHLTRNCSLFLLKGKNTHTVVGHCSLCQANQCFFHEGKKSAMGFSETLEEKTGENCRQILTPPHKKRCRGIQQDWQVAGNRKS